MLTFEICVLPQPSSCAIDRHDCPLCSFFTTDTRCSKVRAFRSFRNLEAIVIHSNFGKTRLNQLCKCVRIFDVVYKCTDFRRILSMHFIGYEVADQSLISLFQFQLKADQSRLSFFYLSNQACEREKTDNRNDVWKLNEHPLSVLSSYTI